MALTVENGTGLGDADAFVSRADCDAYHTAHGNSAWDGTNDDKDAAIRRATVWVSQHFNWKGQPVQGRNQALAWPRYWASDRYGWPVDTTSVPQEVIDATCEAALRELTTPGTLTPDVTLTARVRSERVGPIATEYAVLPASADAERPVVTLISDILRGLLRGGNAYSGRVGR